MVSYHVKFDEDLSTHYGDIAPTSFSYMTPYDFDPMTLYT